MYLGSMKITFLLVVTRIVEIFFLFVLSRFDLEPKKTKKNYKTCLHLNFNTIPTQPIGYSEVTQNSDESALKFTFCD